MTQAKDPPVKWSIERYHQAVNAGVFEDWNVELLNGELIEVSPEAPLHADRIDDLQYYLIDLIPRNQAKIRIGHPVTLPDGSEPEPDIALVRPASYRDSHPGGNDILLIIEFANTSLTKDTEGEKYTAYAIAGIQDYWVVDLQANRLLVNQNPTGDRFSSTTRFNQGMVKPLLLDVAISVEKLLGGSG